jgi:hypothetical protein
MLHFYAMAKAQQKSFYNVCISSKTCTEKRGYSFIKLFKMKRLLIILFALFFGDITFSQTKNLVLNPSFEETWFKPELVYKNDAEESEYFHTCYHDINNVAFCDSFCVKYWYTKMDRGVYYYSAKNVYTAHYTKYENGNLIDSVSYKNDYKIFSVPNNLDGYIPAVTGKSYLGFVPIWWAGPMNPITGRLSETLKKDSIYKFSFYLRNSGKSSYLCLKKMEVKFSREKDIFKDYPPGFFWYQMVFNKKKNRFKPDLSFNIIELCDSSYWKKYEATYKAKGGEQFLTIGIFFQDEDLIQLTGEYMNNYKDEKWEKHFLKKQSNTNLFFNNENYNIEEIERMTKNRLDKTKRPLYLIDEVSVELVK